jgi:aspartate/methionine/tyrosine aminotransferase
MSALVSPGDEVIVQRPMYAAVTGIARAIGAHVVTWDVEERADTWARIETLERLLTQKTRVVAIAQPNNPTGDVLGLDEIAALIDLIGPLGVWLLSDEVYRDLVLDRDLTVTSAVERYGHAISIGDVAKPFGLGGLRVGWLVARDDAIRERIRARRDYTTLSTPTLSDTLAQIALRHSAELLRRPVASARQNLAALTALAMRDHAVSFVRPRAGLTAFVRVDGAFALQQRLAADGILVVPGDLFDCSDHLRIWLGASIAEFSHALEHITRHLSPSAVQRGEELVTDST